jgi:tRNA(Arg) A34 adenosine deaminase TadA
MMPYESLSLPWQVCAEQAWAAFLLKSVPIGACLLDEDGKLVSKGRNHCYDDAPTDGIAPWVSQHKLAHAELNCLLGARDRVTFRGTALYSTVEPCPLCMGAIYMAGVREIHFASADPYAGSTNLLDTTWYLSVKQSRVHRCENETFVMLMAAWNFYFFFYEKRRRGEFWATQDAVMSRWAAAYSTAYQLGRKVWEQYPLYDGPFLPMDAREGLAFWEAQI